MTKAAQKNKLQAPNYGDVKFINYALSNEQKIKLKAVDFTPEDLISHLDKLVTSDYKVSFSYDDYEQCYACFLIAKGRDHLNKGLILAARGSTCIKAFKQAMYIHFELFEENWVDWYQSPGGGEIDD